MFEKKVTMKEFIYYQRDNYSKIRKLLNLINIQTDRIKELEKKVQELGDEVQDE